MKMKIRQEISQKMQLSLGMDDESEEPIQLNLADAEISYFPHFLSRSQADRLLKVLYERIEWEQVYIQIFGKQQKVPRLQAWYGDAEALYSYSGLQMLPKPWFESLAALRDKCSKAADINFNSVLANLYRDGNDGMGFHSDDEPELGEKPVIASLSLGEVRNFDLKHKTKGYKQRIELAHGSLLIMAGDTQRYWQHGINKSKKALSKRINLTFRQIKQE